MTAAKRLQREITKWGFEESYFTPSSPFSLPTWDAAMIAGARVALL